MYRVSVPLIISVVAAMAALVRAETLESGPRNFTTPEDAVAAVSNAFQNDDMDELVAIFGPGSKDLLSSGDPVDDRNRRRVVALAIEQRWTLNETGTDSRELVIGREDWPFPIPLVRESDTWHFDTAAGEEEILARRIGRNELTVMRVCRACVVAQREYASQGHDGKPAGLYAQKIASDPGKQDGLYWPTERGEEPSPFGALVAEATAEGYAVGQSKKPSPYHGYYYRSLTAQGPAAPGGARNYIVNGEMTGGFALVAYPAEYADSGIMTFIVSQDGILYEKDLGEDSARLASEIKDYNPDESWTRVEP